MGWEAWGPLGPHLGLPHGSEAPERPLRDKASRSLGLTTVSACTLYLVINYNKGKTLLVARVWAFCVAIQAGGGGLAPAPPTMGPPYLTHRVSPLGWEGSLLLEGELLLS